MRKTTDQVNWSDSDSYLMPGGTSAGARRVAVSPTTGSRFAVGNAYDASPVGHWIVRRL